MNQNMKLREEFENSIKGDNISKLFESSNKEYIKWLESKVQVLRATKDNISTEDQVFGFIRDNKPNGEELFEWGMDNGMIVQELAQIVQDLIKNKKVIQKVHSQGVETSIDFEAIEEEKIETDNNLYLGYASEDKKTWFISKGKLPFTLLFYLKCESTELEINIKESYPTVNDIVSSIDGENLLVKSVSWV